MALPADRETMLREIAEKHAERFRDWEDHVWDEGLALYGKSKPQDRLRWYMSQTPPVDQSLALDPDYRANRKAVLEALAAKYQTDVKQIEQQYIKGAFMEEIPFTVRPFRVETAFVAYQEQAALVAQAQQEAETGGVAFQAPQIQPPPMMWVQLMGMSGRFMQKVQRDFRHCLDQQAEREGLVDPARAVTQPPSTQPQAVGY